MVYFFALHGLTKRRDYEEKTGFGVLLCSRSCSFPSSRLYSLLMLMLLPRMRQRKLTCSTSTRQLLRQLKALPGIGDAYSEKIITEGQAVRPERMRLVQKKILAREPPTSRSSTRLWRSRSRLHFHSGMTLRHEPYAYWSVAWNTGDFGVCKSFPTVFLNGKSIPSEDW